MTIKPDYYDEFSCIADKCSFTCCKEWKIAVDEKTYNNWINMPIPKRTGLRNGIKGKLSDKVRNSEDGTEIILGTDCMCPFLNEKGLCDIVLEYGEENISHTCHTFPREVHKDGNRVELTLTMGCPEALDKLWSRERFETVSDDRNRLKAGADGNAHRRESEDNPYIYIRDKFINLASDRVYSAEQVIKMCFFILLDIFEKNPDGVINPQNSVEVNSSQNSDLLIEPQNQENDMADILQPYFKPEFICKLAATIDGAPRDEYDYICEQNELFLDLADNYRKKHIYSNVLEPLAAIAERFEKDNELEHFSNVRCNFEPIWEQNEDKLRLLLCEELYSTLYLPGGDVYTMLLKLEWIGITFAVLKQMACLKWTESGKLEYEDLRSIVCVLIRMTGYSEGDIEEYLENSFEDSVWDWGYMGLIV